mgnify:CR=1 FL=1|tara:strand:- start:585 stop:977 length:393 start_codon:yes stop_codon:yes gene_type:complete
MRTFRELAISMLFFLLLSLSASTFPILYPTTLGNFNFVFGAAFTFCLMLPLFVIPIARNVITVPPKLERIALFGYWIVTFGYVLYGFFYDSSEPALKELIFTWLLVIWVIGLPVLFFVSWVWNRDINKMQ